MPKAQRRPWVAEIDAIKAAVAREFGRRPEELSRRRGGEDKRAAIYLCRELTMLTGLQIGKAFGVRGSQVSHIVGRVGATAGRGRRKRLDRLRREIAGHA
jgi:chromosomal replication initiation ATPase DnaA